MNGDVVGSPSASPRPVISEHRHQFYINGRWTDPAAGLTTFSVINPATEEEIAQVAAASPADVDAAAQAAHAAFPAYSRTTREERLGLLKAVLAAYRKRHQQIAATMTAEVGIPARFSDRVQARIAERHLEQMIKVLEEYAFEEQWGSTWLFREPIGVCALISPWNWPMNQVMVKVAPALAAGCTMILKPSQHSPLSTLVFAEVMEEAGVPVGVFNMVNGPGAVLGGSLASHPLVDMVSVTGSTTVGAATARSAADSIKRVSQELGGKSANIILGDVDVETVVSEGVKACMRNSGQSCNAPTRMLVAESIYEQAVAVAARVADELVVGDPWAAETFLGPVAGKKQYDTVMAYIEAGIREGARLVAGGTDRPAGLARGYYVRPTVFADVNGHMIIAREEIFGPVLCLTPFTDDDEAVALANDGDYGLSGYVYSADLERARSIARRLRTGMVHINGATADMAAPFGGYKKSGNGREWGRFGLEEYLEVKAVMGYEPLH
jgi:aldehyde dehydrogenase (NAD+)